MAAQPLFPSAVSEKGRYTIPESDVFRRAFIAEPPSQKTILPQRAQRPQRTKPPLFAFSALFAVKSNSIPLWLRPRERPRGKNVFACRGTFPKQFSRKKAQKAQKDWTGFCALLRLLAANGLVPWVGCGCALLGSLRLNL
jgi:hypothetical protein